MKPTNLVTEVKQQLERLFDELLIHDGYGDLRLEIRILKRGQKEIILHCGKQHRYVVDFQSIVNKLPKNEVNNQ